MIAFEFIVDNICVFDSSFVQKLHAINVLGCFQSNYLLLF